VKISSSFVLTAALSWAAGFCAEEALVNPKGVAQLTPDPTAGSAACMPLPRIVHLFSESDRKKLAESDFDIIVDHTSVVSENDPPKGFAFFGKYVELFPVFVSSDRKIESLSHDQLTKALQGSTNWGALGEAPDELHLYAHKGDLQKEAFNALMKEKMKLSSEVARSRAKDYAGNDYVALEAAGKKDPNAMVIGLRKASDGLKAVQLDHVSITDKEASKNYPLSMTVRIYKKDTPRADETLAALVESINKNSIPQK
jgi:hypothetical protein